MWDSLAIKKNPYEVQVLGHTKIFFAILCVKTSPTCYMKLTGEKLKLEHALALRTRLNVVLEGILWIAGGVDTAILR